MRAHRILVVTIGLMVLPLADAADPDTIAKEGAKFEGSWQAIGGESEGNEVPAEAAAPMRLIIKGSQLTVMDDAKVGIEGNIVIVDVVDKTLHLNFKGRASTDSPVLSIAEWIDVDTFRACVGGEKRPTKFSTRGEGAGMFIVKFRRIKK